MRAYGLSADILYYQTLTNIINVGKDCSPRGIKTREILGYVGRLHNPEQNIITIPGLETNLEYAKAELEWYLSGTSRIKDLPEKYWHIWEKFSDDGERVNSAYGQYIFRKYLIKDKDGKYNQSKSQWQIVKEILENDRESRQGVINILEVENKLQPTKDMPCTISLQYLIRDDKLYAITTMRSNDAYLGFRNDLYCFTELQKKMAKELNIDTGWYQHNVGSLHLYGDKISKIKTALGY